MNTDTSIVTEDNMIRNFVTSSDKAVLRIRYIPQKSDSRIRDTATDGYTDWPPLRRRKAGQ